MTHRAIESILPPILDLSQSHAAREAIEAMEARVKRARDELTALAIEAFFESHSDIASVEFSGHDSVYGFSMQCSIQPKTTRIGVASAEDSLMAIVMANDSTERLAHRTFSSARAICARFMEPKHLAAWSAAREAAALEAHTPNPTFSPAPRRV
jgi:hypothetical protein